jgi:hypothetical protein
MAIAKKRAFDARQGRFVGRGHDHHRFAPSRFIQVFFQELAHFATAFTNERDDVDVSLRLAGDHAQQGGFADAAAGENAQTLAPSTRDERVDGLDARSKLMLNALPLERVRWQALDASQISRRYRAATVQGTAQAINHPPHQRVADRHLQRRSRGNHFAADVDPMRLAQGHQQQVMIAKADDLRVRLVVLLARLDLTTSPMAAGGPWDSMTRPIS